MQAVLVAVNALSVNWGWFCVAGKKLPESSKIQGNIPDVFAKKVGKCKKIQWKSTVSAG
jgi:hypothetical protein